MIIKVLKNEYLKLFSEKKLYIFLSIIIFMAFLSAYMYYDISIKLLNNTLKKEIPDELRDIYLNLTPLNFLKLYATDFVYKPILQLLLIFVSIHAVSTFCEDYTSGNMKFLLISRLNKTQIYLGKLVYLLTIIIVLVLANIIFGYIAGMMFFGTGGFKIGMLLDVLMLYFFSVIPTFALVVIISILSLIINRSSALVAISIFSVFTLTTFDLYTSNKYYSPVGAMSLMGFSTSAPTIDFIITNTVSLVYVVIGLFALLKMVKHKDILM